MYKILRHEEYKSKSKASFAGTFFQLNVFTVKSLCDIIKGTSVSPGLATPLFKANTKNGLVSILQTPRTAVPNLFLL